MQVNLSIPKRINRLRGVETRHLYRRSLVSRYAPWITLIVVLVLWQLLTMIESIPAWLIPSPLVVVEKFLQVIADGRLVQHAGATLIEVVLGLFFGVSIAVILGYLVARNRLLEDFLSPIIVALQSTPVVAYAPLLIIWFGSGIASKVIICALIVFFPMLMNTIVGIRNVPDDLRDLMRVSQATRWQMLIKLEVPAALPVLLTGLKTSATLAVIGAVVGEFINASQGLGFLVKIAQNQFDTPLVFVAVITLAFIARFLYGLVAMLERRLLVWQLF